MPEVLIISILKRTWGDLNPRPWDPKSHVIFLARLQAQIFIKFEYN